MKLAYPAIFTPIEEGLLVYVPDLEINTSGNDFCDAVRMARDAISIWCVAVQDEGKGLPAPSRIAPNHGPNELVSWVDVDLDRYRRALDTTSERTNITLPRYLKTMAAEAGLNLSQELQTRLKEVLNVDCAV